MKKTAFTWKCLLVCSFLIISIFALSQIQTSSSNYSHAAGIRDKRVLSVTIEKNDSIWSIAKQYYTEECGSLENYIDEIKRSNSLGSDTIFAGSKIIVPVWATDAEAKAIKQQEESV